MLKGGIIPHHTYLAVQTPRGGETPEGGYSPASETPRSQYANTPQSYYNATGASPSSPNPDCMYVCTCVSLKYSTHHHSYTAHVASSWRLRSEQDRLAHGMSHHVVTSILTVTREPSPHSTLTGHALCFFPTDPPSTCRIACSSTSSQQSTTAYVFASVHLLKY